MLHPDPLMQLVHLGYHAHTLSTRVQRLATQLVLTPLSPAACDAIEAEIEELADDASALFAALRAELGRQRSMLG